jgi:hypothetical protein
MAIHTATDDDARFLEALNAEGVRIERVTRVDTDTEMVTLLDDLCGPYTMLVPGVRVVDTRELV